MKTLYLAVSFLMTLGIILGIYTASYNQFNLNGASLTYSTQTFAINDTNQQIGNTLTGTISGTVTTTSNTTSGQSGCGILCNVWDSIVNVAVDVCNFTALNIFGTGACTSIGNNIAPVETNLGNQAIILAGSNGGSQTTSNNTWLKLFANPLDSALTIMGIFLGLGILAGLLGAGILARVMASVGIGLALIDYIESSISVFTGLPSLIYIGFNGIIGLLLLIIAWEAFNAPGGTS